MVHVDPDKRPIPLSKWQVGSQVRNYCGQGFGRDPNDALTLASFPGPHPAFFCLQFGKLGGAWERDYYLLHSNGAAMN